MADSTTASGMRNPSGLCMCGCGMPAPLSRDNDATRGFVKGEPMLYIRGHKGRRLGPKLTCSVDGCSRPSNARGMCSVHYGRWKTYGDPLVVLRRDLPIDERFWSMVMRGGDDECWLWTGGHSGSGYGAFSPGKRATPIPAHRYAYESVVGPIPEGLEIDHLCRNRGCVNPKHLEPVTPQENIRRADLANGKGSAATHCPHGHAYDEANTRHYAGRRHCRACARERARLLTSLKGLPELKE